MNGRWFLFFFSSRRRHTRSYGDWSSDVCSSDLLAVAFALDETKTALLVDCNFGNPAFDHLITDEDRQGITDYIEQDQLQVEQIIHATGVRRLRLVPAGESHNFVAEYFTSAKLQGLLKGLRDRYRDRYVIIDAPPITQSADARILVEMADYVLLVVPYGRITESE